MSEATNDPSIPGRVQVLVVGMRDDVKVTFDREVTGRSIKVTHVRVIEAIEAMLELQPRILICIDDREDEWMRRLLAESNGGTSHLTMAIKVSQSRGEVLVKHFPRGKEQLVDPNRLTEFMKRILMEHI